MVRWVLPVAAALVVGVLLFLARSEEATTGRAGAEHAAGDAPSPAPSDPILERLAAALRDDDRDRRIDAAVELRGLGDRAVPVFVDLLADGDRDGRLLAVRSLGRLEAGAARALGELLREDDKALRLAALEALRRIESADAVAPVLPMLRVEDRDVVLAALGALEAIGPASEPAALAVAAVLEPARGDDVDRAALAALETIGPPALAVLPKLLAAFENRPLLSPAIEVIEAIGPAARAAVPALIEVIRAEERADEEERQAMLESMSIAVVGSHWGPYPEFDAARALVAIGPRAVPEVLAMLGDDLWGVRREGSDILAKIGARALAHLEAAAVHADPNVRQAVARALESYGKEHPEFLGVLARLAADPEVDVRARALESLGRYGPAATDVLVGALDESGRQLLEPALGSLARVRFRDSAAVPRLVELLDHEESVVRWRAADVLASMGEAAGAGIPALVRHLGDESRYMRISARETLEKLGDVAVPAILAGLEGASADTRRGAALLLAKHEKPTARMAAAASGLLTSADLSVRTLAAATLARAGVEDDALLPTLVAGLGAGPKEVREAAAGGVRLLGAKAAPALPAILRVHAREHEDRVLLGDTLAAVGAHDPAVLARGLASDSWDVSYDCGSALKKIGAPAVPVLVAMLARGPRDARIKAAAILRVTATTVPAARDALEQAARDPDVGVANKAIDALMSATNDAAFLVPLLLAKLDSDSPRQRERAAYRLSRLGARAAFAVRDLRAAHTAAKGAAVRKWLAAAIRKIEER